MQKYKLPEIVKKYYMMQIVYLTLVQLKLKVNLKWYSTSLSQWGISEVNK